MMYPCRVMKATLSPCSPPEIFPMMVAVPPEAMRFKFIPMFWYVKVVGDGMVRIVNVPSKVVVMEAVTGGVTERMSIVADEPAPPASGIAVPVA